MSQIPDYRDLKLPRALDNQSDVTFMAEEFLDQCVQHSRTNAGRDVEAMYLRGRGALETLAGTVETIANVAEALIHYDNYSVDDAIRDAARYVHESLYALKALEFNPPRHIADVFEDRIERIDLIVRGQGPGSDRDYEIPSDRGDGRRGGGVYSNRNSRYGGGRDRDVYSNRGNDRYSDRRRDPRDEFADRRGGRRGNDAPRTIRNGSVSTRGYTNHQQDRRGRDVERTEPYQPRNRQSEERDSTIPARVRTGATYSAGDSNERRVPQPTQRIAADSIDLGERNTDREVYSNRRNDGTPPRQQTVNVQEPTTSSIPSGFVYPDPDDLRDLKKFPRASSGNIIVTKANANSLQGPFDILDIYSPATQHLEYIYSYSTGKGEVIVVDNSESSLMDYNLHRTDTFFKKRILGDTSKTATTTAFEEALKSANNVIKLNAHEVVEGDATGDAPVICEESFRVEEPIEVSQETSIVTTVKFIADSNNLPRSYLSKRAMSFDNYTYLDFIAHTDEEKVAARALNNVDSTHALVSYLVAVSTEMPIYAWKKLHDDATTFIEKSLLAATGVDMSIDSLVSDWAEIRQVMGTLNKGSLVDVFNGLGKNFSTAYEAITVDENNIETIPLEGVVLGDVLIRRRANVVYLPVTSLEFDMSLSRKGSRVTYSNNPNFHNVVSKLSKSENFFNEFYTSDYELLNVYRTIDGLGQDAVYHVSA